MPIVLHCLKQKFDSVGIVVKINLKKESHSANLYATEHMALAKRHQTKAIPIQ